MLMLVRHQAKGLVRNDRSLKISTIYEALFYGLNFSVAGLI